jgi:predicted transcriptional regulator
MKAIDYLNAVKEKLNVTSTYKLGKVLKVSKQMARKYETGESIPGPVVAFRVAEILGEQPAAVLTIFEQERAERDGKPEEAEEWKGWLKRLAAILAVAGIGGFPFGDANLAHAQQTDNLYIV